MIEPIAAEQFVPFSEVSHLPLSSALEAGRNGRHELRAGEAWVALMVWESQLYQASAMVYSAEGAWHLTRRGFSTLQTRLWPVGSTEPALQMEDNRLTLRDGRMLQWRSTNFWSTKLGFFDATSSQSVVQLQRPLLSRYSANITFSAEAPLYSELFMLVITGWYLCIWYQMGSDPNNSYVVG